jgi:hypothetical protein
MTKVILNGKPLEQHVAERQKHTPGPWTVQNAVTIMESGSQPRRLIFPPDDNPDVAIVAELNADPENESEYPIDQLEANARLIAAAPDQHAALVGMAQEFAAYVNDEEDADIKERNTAWLTQARAAIAKAGAK